MSFVAGGILLLPVTAFADPVRVIITHDGVGRAALEARIAAVGGVVSKEYVNVPAVAALLPEGTVLEGVTVERDRVIELGTSLARDKNENDDTVPRVSLQSPGVAFVSGGNATMLAPEGYANILHSGAAEVWDETGFGVGSVVAVVDTGTNPVFCISNSVIGAPGFPDGFNATGDGISPMSPLNHWHGTAVAGVIASNCGLSLDSGDPFYQAVQAGGLPWTPDFIPVVGQAPGALIYPVKVFPATDEGALTSDIIAGLDHLISLKESGALDVDIANLSLGGATLYDGYDVFDRFLLRLEEAGILAVVAAGNEGPKSNSIASPATSFASISVGAADYAASSRVIYEYLGLVEGLGAGQADVMRPTWETRIANFSSRGPTSDGRRGVDIAALGQWNFAQLPDGGLSWVSGTSFAAPTVAGAAALLTAWLKVQGYGPSPRALRKALLGGADASAVDRRWRDVRSQGDGLLDVPAALEKLQRNNDCFRDNRRGHERANYVGVLKSNMLGAIKKGKTQTGSSGTVKLAPSQVWEAVVDVNELTSSLKIELENMSAPNNFNTAYWPNALEVHIHGAERTGVQSTLSFFWYPYLTDYGYGPKTTIEITDGLWYWDGEPVVQQVLQPGLYKVTIVGDYTNQADVSFRAKLTRQNNRDKLRNAIEGGPIKNGDELWYEVEVPATASVATFDLVWKNDWSRFPTSDLDLTLIDPSWSYAVYDGATLSAPERAQVFEPGIWTVIVTGYDVPARRDQFDLFVRFE